MNESQIPMNNNGETNRVNPNNQVPAIENYTQSDSPDYFTNLVDLITESTFAIHEEDRKKKIQLSARFWKPKVYENGSFLFQVAKDASQVMIIIKGSVIELRLKDNDILQADIKNYTSKCERSQGIMSNPSNSCSNLSSLEGDQKVINYSKRQVLGLPSYLSKLSGFKKIMSTIFDVGSPKENDEYFDKLTKVFKYERSNTLVAGDVLGEMQVKENGVHLVSAIAAGSTDVHVIELSRMNFLRIFHPNETNNNKMNPLTIHSKPGTSTEQTSKQEKESFFQEFFETVSRTQLKTFMSFCKPATLPLNTILFRKGEKPDKIYFIISGRIEISDKVTGSTEESMYNEGQSPTNLARKRLQKQLVYEAFRGSLVGEMEIVFSEDLRRFTATAVEETRVFVMQESSYRICASSGTPAIIAEITRKTELKKEWINQLLQKKANSLEKLSKFKLDKNRNRPFFKISNSVEFQREKHIAQLQDSFQILQRKYINKPPASFHAAAAAATSTNTIVPSSNNNNNNNSNNSNNNTSMSSPMTKGLKFFGATDIPREYLQVDIFADDKRSPFEALSPLLQSKLPLRHQKSISPLKTRKPSIEFGSSSPATPKEGQLNSRFSSPLAESSSLPQIPTFDKKFLQLKRLQSSTQFVQEEKKQQPSLSEICEYKHLKKAQGSLSRINTSLDDFQESSERNTSSKQEQSQQIKQSDMHLCGGEVIQQQQKQPQKYSLSSSYTVSPNKFNLRKVFKQSAQTSASGALTQLKKTDVSCSFLNPQFFFKQKELTPTKSIPQLSKNPSQTIDSIAQASLNQSAKLIDKTLLISGITNNTTCPTDDTQTRSPTRKRSSIWQRGVIKKPDESPTAFNPLQPPQQLISTHSSQQLSDKSQTAQQNSHFKNNYNAIQQCQQGNHTNNIPDNLTTNNQEQQREIDLAKNRKKSLYESLGISSLMQENNQHNNFISNLSFGESHAMIIRNLSPSKPNSSVSSPSHRKLINQSEHQEQNHVGNFFNRFKSRQSLNNINEILKRSNQCRFKAMNLDQYTQKSVNGPIPIQQQLAISTASHLKTKLVADQQEKQRIHSQIGLYVSSNSVVGASQQQLLYQSQFPSRDIKKNFQPQKLLKHQSLHSSIPLIFQ